MPNNIVFMCGSHPRHFYVAKRLHEAGRLKALVVEKREDFQPLPDSSWPSHLQELFKLHFQRRQESECHFFGDAKIESLSSQVETLTVSRDELNSDKTMDFVSSFSVSLLFTYGVHRIEENIFSRFVDRAFNIHGGLSPWFRGNATMFWPFYLLKPNYAGMTIHRLTSRLDGGDILHHSLPELHLGDGIHDVANRAIVQAADDVCKILALADEGRKLTCVPQKNIGKLFTSSDWTPQLLRLVYDLYDDHIVDEFLSGNLVRSDPEIVDFFSSSFQ